LKTCSLSLFPHSIDRWKALALRQRKKRGREKERTPREREGLARIVSREKKSC
jgi:hypothetical protein